MFKSRILPLLPCLVLVSACQPDLAPVASQPEENVSAIRVTGEVHSANSRNYGAPSIHKIWQYTIAYMAPDGARVAQGQEVLRFDTQELQTKILNKQNALNEKQKELEKQQIIAREQLAELRLLVEKARAEVDKAALKAEIPENLLARRDYLENQLVLEQARKTLALRKVEVEKDAAVQATESVILEREIAVLQSELEELQASVMAMSIIAPTDGVVIHSLDRHGNKMSVGDNVWGGRRVVEFPDLAQLELRLEIPERDSARVKIGQQVSFTMDALPDQVFYGTITELASVVHTRSASQPAKIFDATVALLAPDPDLMRPGMSVNARILIGLTEKAGP
jgi:HlyD family secretion protein